MTDKQIIENKNGFYCIEPCSEIKELQADLKRKEQEYEELKEAIDSILTTLNVLAKSNIKLREILAEIKEIAEKNINIHPCAFKGCGYDLITSQILQKISEVEDVSSES
jgi:uncharacterized protein YydD (DUF2326 family)